MATLSTDKPAANRRDDLDAGRRLRITEIFHSLQGESRPTGLPTAFVRLTGCPLRCGYCDTAYAFEGGDWFSFDDILAQVGSYQTPLVCVTGGEPLAQANCLALLTELADAGFEVSLETSGALDIAPVDPRISVVLDIKTPGSGEQARNRLENLQHLKAADQLKFVICDRDDYAWAKSFVDEHQLIGRCEVMFSPSIGQLEPRDLAEWMLADRLQIRFQVQLHKFLWGDTPGH